MSAPILALGLPVPNPTFAQPLTIDSQSPAGWTCTRTAGSAGSAFTAIEGPSTYKYRSSRITFSGTGIWEIRSAPCVNRFTALASQVCWNALWFRIDAAVFVLEIALLSY
jgi:hypothetical protein